MTDVTAIYTVTSLAAKGISAETVFSGTEFNNLIERWRMAMSSFAAA